MANMATFQGQPANATFSVAHNDSFPFEDNVDATHAANLRYIVSKNVQQVVSARLSIFMAPYRTYNNFSATTTAGESVTHTHPASGQSNNHNHGHGHTVPIAATAVGQTVNIAAANGSPFTSLSGPMTSAAINTDSTAANVDHSHAANANTVDHQHLISVTSVLGVTEGATATGVTVAFDGVLSSLGPFNADVIELDVRSLIQVQTGIKHTIAMQPSGNGRIEAFLRLGCYVSASQTL